MYYLLGTVLLITLIFLPGKAHASNKPQFIQPIVPLECTIETIATGTGPKDIITCPQPDPPPEEPPSDNEETLIPSGVPSGTRLRFEKALLESIGELPDGSIKTPIQTPENHRFGIQIDGRPWKTPKPDHVTPIYLSAITLALLAITFGLRYWHLHRRWPWSRQ